MRSLGSRVEVGALLTLGVFTATAVLGYAFFAARPQNLALVPFAAEFFGISFRFFAQLHILLAFGALAIVLAATTVAMEGGGRATVYAGGWSDYMAQRGEGKSESVRKDEKPKASAPKVKQDTTPAPGLSFTESHRLKELPKVIDRLNAEIAKLEAYLALPDLYTAEPVKFAKGTEALAERQAALAEAEEEWLTLEEKAEAASG